MEKFASTVNQGGVLIYEGSLPVKPSVRSDVRVIAFPAMKIAADNGVPKAANTAFLGCMSALGLIGLPEEALIAVPGIQLRRETAAGGEEQAGVRGGQGVGRRQHKVIRPVRAESLDSAAGFIFFQPVTTHVRRPYNQCRPPWITLK